MVPFPSPPLHPHLVHDFSWRPPSSCSRSWHELPPSVLLARWLPTEIRSRSPSHRRRSPAADGCCRVSPQRHASVSPCDSLIHPAEDSSLVLLLPSCGSGWRPEGKQKGRVRAFPHLSLRRPRKWEESPAPRFRSRALCKLPSPPSLSLSVPTSLVSFHLPSPSCYNHTNQRERMRARRRGREEVLRAEIGCPRGHVTPGRGLRDPLPAVQLMLPSKPLLPLTTAAVQHTNHRAPDTNRLAGRIYGPRLLL